MGFGTSRICFFLTKGRQNEGLVFTIDIQTPLQIARLLEFGHNGALWMDAKSSKIPKIIWVVDYYIIQNIIHDI